MLKLSLIAIVVLLLSVFVGKVRAEYGVCLALGGCLLILSMSMERIKTLVEGLEQIREFTGIRQEYITILLKMLGISYLAEFSASLCKDAGQSSIATQIDFASKISMLLLSMPILTSLLKTMEELLT